jgi:hypothetical protein
MKKYSFLSIFFLHLSLPGAYAGDENTVRIRVADNMEDQGILVSSPVEHAFIFNETTNIAITTQSFTLRFHFGGEFSNQDIFYKKSESSFSQNSINRITRVDSKTRFTKLRFLQI